MKNSLTKKLDYDYMIVFGCLVYVRNTDTIRDKFEVRGDQEYSLVIHKVIKKGYYILDIEDKKVIASRDVKFVENKFPFLQRNS